MFSVFFSFRPFSSAKRHRSPTGQNPVRNQLFDFHRFVAKPSLFLDFCLIQLSSFHVFLKLLRVDNNKKELDRIWLSGVQTCNIQNHEIDRQPNFSFELHLLFFKFNFTNRSELVKTIKLKWKELNLFKMHAMKRFSFFLQESGSSRC